MAPVLKGNSTSCRPKNTAKRRAPDLKNQEWGYRPRYSTTQGFNLLQISPNWFPGNWTLDPWALASHSAIKVKGLFCFSRIEISQTTLPLISLMVLLECSPWVGVHRAPTYMILLLMYTLGTVGMPSVSADVSTDAPRWFCVNNVKISVGRLLRKHLIIK
jgi:hypothetical protein